MAIYLQFGTKIKGNVTAEGHDGWIECSSFQFGCGRGVSMPVGRGSDREVSAPSISEMTLTKELDDSSALLFQESLSGQGRDDATIHVVRTQASKLETVLEYTLANAVISSYSISSGGDRPSESLSISFTKVEMKYIGWDKSGTKEGQTPVSYDLATAKAG